MAGALAFAAGPTVAEEITYHFSGSFQAPATGSFSGTYVYDTTTASVISSSVQTTAGRANDGVASLPAGNFTVITHQSPNSLRISSAPDATNLRGARLGPAPLAASGVVYFRESRCVTFNCFTMISNGDVDRVGEGTSFLVPAPAPVPTLSEWAMILLGVMLAGGAALTIQRRRTA